MPQDQNEFKAIFERVVPELLSLAVAHLKGDPRLTDVWILIACQNKAANSATVYKFDNRFIPLANELKKQYPEFGGAAETILSMAAAMRPLFFELRNTDELPAQTLIHYDVRSESMDAKFTHEPIKKEEGRALDLYVSDWANSFTG